MNDQTGLGKIDALFDLAHGMQGQIDGLLCVVSDLEQRLSALARVVRVCEICRKRQAAPEIEFCRHCALELARRMLAEGHCSACGGTGRLKAGFCGCPAGLHAEANWERWGNEGPPKGGIIRR